MGIILPDAATRHKTVVTARSREELAGAIQTLKAATTPQKVLIAPSRLLNAAKKEMRRTNTSATLRNMRNTHRAYIAGSRDI
jgi:hypothetical protein